MLVLVTVLALIVGAAVTGRPPAAAAASAAMAYVPPSGTRVLLQGSDGTDTVDEYVSRVGIPVVQSGPVAVGYAADPATEDLGSMTWVRVNELTADAQGRVSDRSTQVFAAQPSGLELRVAAFATSFLAFRPGLPVLPARVRAGDTWRAQGRAIIGDATTATGTQPYAAEFRATDAGTGCVAVAATLRVGSGTNPVTSTSSTTWCAGRGMTAGSDSARSTVAVDRAPVWQRLGRAVDDRVARVAPSGTWERRDLAGPPPISISSRVPPVALPDAAGAGPVLVFANLGDDLIARGWNDGPTNARWFATPGGSVSGLLAVGRVVIATTTQRRVVAYGAQGEFLWQAELGDVNKAPPVRLGTQVVVAGLDGSVTAFDAETGAVAWRGSTPTEIVLPPVADRHGVTVVDQAGNLRTYAPDGTVVHSIEVQPPESFTVMDGLAVVAARSDAVVRGYQLRDGIVVWRTPVVGARVSMVPLGALVLICRRDALVALRASDGAPAWTRPMVPTTLAALDANSALVSDRTSLYLLDGTGAVRATWVTQQADLDASPQPVLSLQTGEALLVQGTVGYRWRPS